MNFRWAVIGRHRLDKIDWLTPIGRVTSRAAIQEQHNTLVVSKQSVYRCILQIYCDCLNRFSYFLVFSRRRGREMPLWFSWDETTTQRFAGYRGVSHGNRATFRPRRRNMNNWESSRTLRYRLAAIWTARKFTLYFFRSIETMDRAGSDNSKEIR